jgi:hypothetical protein
MVPCAKVAVKRRAADTSRDCVKIAQSGLSASDQIKFLWWLLFQERYDHAFAIDKLNKLLRRKDIRRVHILQLPLFEHIKMRV